mgnify:CR=1 FL=1
MGTSIFCLEAEALFASSAFLFLPWPDLALLFEVVVVLAVAAVFINSSYI